MPERRLAISRHAKLRLAQRNLSIEDVEYVLAHGQAHQAASATIVHLGRRDIPFDHQRLSRLRRLEGTVLVLQGTHREHLVTVYRNRRRGSRDIKRKAKYALPTDGLVAGGRVRDALAENVW